MNIKYDYTLNDIKKTINKIRIYKGDTIYISCNLGKLGFPKLKKIDLLPNYLFNIIKKKFLILVQLWRQHILFFKQ